MKYMNCIHTVTANDKVLTMESAGDADSGFVIATDDEFNTVSVYVSSKRLKVYVSESVIHNDNLCINDDPFKEIDDMRNKMDEEYMNTIAKQCDKCGSGVNANGDHINIEHDPLHIFDGFHRFNHADSFSMWLGKVTAKVGYAGQKRHIAHMSVSVSNGTANIMGGNVWCGANKGAMNKHHSIMIEGNVTCDKCINRAQAAHVQAPEILFINDRGELTFKNDFKKYPTRWEKHIALPVEECDNKYCKHHHPAEARAFMNRNPYAPRV
jgi:hypothetical protein